MNAAIAHIIAHQVKARYSKIEVAIRSTTCDTDVEVCIYSHNADYIVIQLKEQHCEYQFYYKPHISITYNQATTGREAFWNELSRSVVYDYSDPAFPNNLLAQIDLALSWPIP